MSDNLDVSPAPVYCAEKSRLLEEFAATVSEYLKVEAIRDEALTRGHEPPLAAALDASHKRKMAAKEAIQAHQKEHNPLSPPLLVPPPPRHGLVAGSRWSFTPKGDSSILVCHVTVIGGA